MQEVYFFEEIFLGKLDYKIYLEVDIDICLSRILLRDINERGRDIHEVFDLAGRLPN